VQLRHAKVWYPAATCKAFITEAGVVLGIVNKMVPPAVTA
jgi:hypothetical protein